MRKINLLLIFLLGAISAATADAQVLDIGQGDNPKTEVKSEPAQDRPAATEDAKVEEKKSSGIFSFMNFSFFKKKTEEPVQEFVREGERVETPFERSTRLAEDGDVNEQLNLGYAYLYGEDGATVDYKKAFKYYAMAAAQNDKVALNNLGSLYFSGIGVDKSAGKAIALFKKASDLGNSEASVNLAFIYISGNGTYKDYNEALDLFEKAAEEKNPTAMFMVGYAYYKGFGYSKDYRKAFEMIKEASASKYDAAQYITGLMYLKGEGVAKNYGNAVRYLRNSAAQGNFEAIMTLGDILAEGQAYPRNVYQAHVLFNVAAANGITGAAEYRDALERELKIEELLRAQSEAEAFVARPSELTMYIRQTFGQNIKGYIDDALKDPLPAKAAKK